MSLQKSKIALIFFIIFHFNSFGQHKDYTVEKIRKNLIEHYPFYHSLYEYNKTIMFDKNEDYFIIIQRLEWYCTIETGISMRNFTLQTETQRAFQKCFEAMFSVKCEDCNSFEEMKKFTSTYSDKVTSNFEMDKDYNLVYIGPKEKENQISNYLIDLIRLQKSLEIDYNLKKRKAFQNWILKNHERIKILKWSHGLKEKKKSPIKNEEAAFYYTTHDRFSIPFFNIAYDKAGVLSIYFEDVTKSLEKYYLIFEGPKTQNNSKILEQELSNLILAGRETENYRVDCERLDNYYVFNPEYFLYNFFYYEPDRGFYLNRYNNLYSKGLNDSMEKSKHIENQNQLLKNLPLKGTKKDTDWPETALTGFQQYMMLTPVGCSGRFIKRDYKNRIIVQIKYSIENNSLREEDFFSNKEYSSKIYVPIPSKPGAFCKKLERPNTSGFGYYKINNDNLIDDIGLQIIRYAYNEKDEIIKASYSKGKGGVKIKDLESYCENIKPNLIINFKNNTLNGILTFNDIPVSIINNKTIPLAIAPLLEINGKKVIQSGLIDSEFRVFKLKLMFKNNLLDGPSEFYWRNTINNETGKVTVQFDKGFSEYSHEMRNTN